MKTILLTICIFLASHLSALDCTWTGAAGNGIWNDPLNWDCGVIPGIADDVTVTMLEDINLSNNTTVNSISLFNGNILGTHDFTIVNDLDLFAGSIATDGLVTIIGIFNWSGGTLAGSGTVNCNGAINWGGQSKNCSNRTISINSGGTWSRGNMALQGNATLLLPNAQILDVTASSITIFNIGTNNKLDIRGALNCNGSSTFNVRCTFDLSGTLNVNSNFNSQGGGTITNANIVIAPTKTLNLRGSFTYEINNTNISGDGIFEAGISAAVNYNSGNFTAGLKISGQFSYLQNIAPNSLELSGGDFVCSINLNIPGDLIWRGGTIIGPNSLTINGTTSIRSSNSGYDLDGADLRVNGPIDQQSTSGIISLNNNTTLTIGVSAVWNKQVRSNFSSDGSNNILINNGILNYNTSGNTAIQCELVNTGTIQLNSGVNLSLQGGGTLDNGTIDVPSGASLFINNGTFTADNVTYPSTEVVTFNAELSVTGNSTYNFPVNFNSTSLIKGVGTASFSSASFAGEIRPGNSPGVLTIDPDLIMMVGHKTIIEISDNSGPGTGHDQLLSNGTIQLNGSIDVEEIGSVADGTFEIIKCDGGPNCLTGTFSSVNLPSLPSSSYILQYTGESVLLTRSSVLPIVLSRFEGFEGEKCNQLRWSTASEVNHRGFHVERSENGIHFKTMAFIESKGSNGVKAQYVYDDCQDLGQRIYYRLKSEDLDGSMEYSEKILITRSVSTSASLVTNRIMQGEKLRIKHPTTEVGKVIIRDNYGSIRSTVQSLEYGEDLPTNHLSTGKYYLILKHNGMLQTIPFVII